MATPAQQAAAFMQRVNAGQANFTDPEILNMLQVSANEPNLQRKVEYTNAVAVAVFRVYQNARGEGRNAQDALRELQGRFNRLQEQTVLREEVNRVIGAFNAQVTTLENQIAGLQSRVKESDVGFCRSQRELIRSGEWKTNTKVVGASAASLGIFFVCLAAGPVGWGTLAFASTYGGLAMAGGVAAGVNDSRKEDVLLDKWNRVEELVKQGHTLENARKRVGI